MEEERPPHGTFHRERRIPMRMVERPQRGAFLPGRRTRTQVEVGAEAHGVVGVEVGEVEEIGGATAGGVKHLEGRTIILMTGRRILG